MKILLPIVAVGEAATGVLLLLDPPIVIKLLFGVKLVGAGVIISRICGISLIALGFACWPGRVPTHAPFRGMLIYSSLAAFYLLYLGLTGQWFGVLLWPAVAVHLILTILLARVWFKERNATKTGKK